MIAGHDRWYQVASQLLEAARTSLTAPVTRAGVVPGAIAWDDCSCGALYVSVAQVYASENFPERREILQYDNCAAPYEVAEILIQVMRCAPQPDGQEYAPTVAALDASARSVLTDGYEVLAGVVCRLREMVDVDIENFITDAQTAQGPSGSCVGSELRVRVALPGS